MSQDHEVARTVSRDEAATLLRQLADGVAAGSVSVEADAGPVAVDVPGDLTFTAELEQFEGEVELEAELEWAAGEGAGTTIRQLDPDADAEADETTDATADEPTDGAAEDEQDAGSADGEDAAVDSEATVTDGEVTESVAADAIESGTDLERLVGPAVDTPADEPASKAKFELFRDAADEWRWRLRHRNGNVIADGGEGYGRKASAIKGLESVKSNAPHAVVEVQERE